MNRALTAAALACVTALVACGVLFSPAEDLTSLRVLAIRSEPVDLAPDGSVTFQVLVYEPDGGPPVAYDWSWCANLGTVSADYACAVTPSQLAASLWPDGGVTLTDDLGSTPEATLVYPGTPQQLAAVCSRVLAFDAGSDGGGAPDAGTDGGGDGGAAFLCNGSFSVDVILDLDAGAPLQSFRALTILLDVPTLVNTNPSILGVSLAEADSGSSVPAGQALTYGETYALTASIPESASDEYMANMPGFGGFGFDGGGDVGLRLESLSIAWYAQVGTFGATTTSLPDGTLLPDGGDGRNWAPLESNTWTAPAASGGGTPQQVTFIWVIRDNRNGVGWLEQSYSLGGAP
jgi:hypothetical protein